MRTISIGYALALAGAAAAIASGINGCASAESTPTPNDTSLPKPGEIADGGADSGKKFGLAPTADLAALGAPRTVFVNAIQGGPDGVRLCFTRFPKARPFPHNQFAPLSNRLGIAKGAATATGTIVAAAAAAHQFGVDDRGAGSDKSLEVALIEAAFMDFAAYSNASCEVILEDTQNAGIRQQPRFVKLTNAQFESPGGLQAIVFTGNWDNKNGIVAQTVQSNIGYRIGASDGVSFQFSNLADLPAAAKSIDLKLGDKKASMDGKIGELSRARVLLNNKNLLDDTSISWINPPLGAPMSFRLVDAQRYLDPSVAPPTYFRSRSNVVMLLVGDASERPKPVSEQLHFIAIPATNPEEPLPASQGTADDTASSPETIAPALAGDAGPDAR